MNEFAEFLEINGLSQVEVAEFLGIGAPTVSKIASGTQKLPKKRKAQLLENTKGWDVTPLLSESSDDGEDDGTENETEPDSMASEIALKDAEIESLLTQIESLKAHIAKLEEISELWSKIAIGKDQICKEKERIIQMLLAERGINTEEQ